MSISHFTHIQIIRNTKIVLQLKKKKKTKKNMGTDLIKRKLKIFFMYRLRIIFKFNKYITKHQLKQ